MKPEVVSLLIAGSVCPGGSTHCFHPCASDVNSIEKVAFDALNIVFVLCTRIFDMQLYEAVACFRSLLGECDDQSAVRRDHTMEGRLTHR